MKIFKGGIYKNTRFAVACSNSIAIYFLYAVRGGNKCASPRPSLPTRSKSEMGLLYALLYLIFFLGS